MPEFDFSQHERGEAVKGASALAGHVFRKPKLARVFYGMSDEERSEWGIIRVNNVLYGFTNWLDLVLHAKARSGARRRKRDADTAEAEGATGTI